MKQLAIAITLEFWFQHQAYSPRAGMIGFDVSPAGMAQRRNFLTWSVALRNVERIERLAANAKTIARILKARAKRRNGITGWNPRDEKGIAWVESLSHSGLRLVGYADEIIRLDHRGWYTDREFQDETLRGVVLQLPGKNHRARFLAAYEDPNNDGTYRVDTEIHLGDILDASWQEDDGKRDAARAADELARVDAEHECEYRDAWQRGQEWRDYTQLIRDSRRDIAALRREIKTAKQLPGVHTARVLLDACKQMRDDSRDAYEKREKLISEWFYNAETKSAFNDGAQQNVIA